MESFYALLTEANHQYNLPKKKEDRQGTILFSRNFKISLSTKDESYILYPGFHKTLSSNSSLSIRMLGENLIYDIRQASMIQQI